MKLTKDNLHDKLVLTLSEKEFFIVLGALRGATADDARRGIAYHHFYSGNKGDVVRLYNQIDEANRKGA